MNHFQRMRNRSAIGLGAFIAVSALGKNGLMSPLSAWGQVQPTQPGQPTVLER